MKSQPKHRLVLSALISLGIAVALVTTAMPCAELFAAQVRHAHRPSSASAIPAEVAMPFHVGEKLDYRIAWSGFNNAATLELSVPERRDLFGWHTWHFRAAFHTVHPVRTLFEIDDQFDSYTDATTLECRQFEMYMNELGKTETKVLHLVAKDQTPRAPGPSVVVLPGTRDPLGMLFTLRAVDWQHTPELRVPVYDGHDLYQVVAHLEAASDQVQVDAGSFNASRVSIEVFQTDNENASFHFTVWYANDAARTPVSMFADLPFGNLRVELTSASPK
jgi:hypothetical protein